MLRLASPVMLCVWIAGCGGGHELPTAPVRVIVTLDGHPVTKGGVHFIPERGRHAKGKLEPDGSAELFTYSEHDGAIIGKHRIAVVAVEEDSSQPTVDRLPTVKWLIPERYGSADTSGLECELIESKRHVVKIELSTDGAGRIVIQ
jgi:hypothetical protein